VCGIFGYIGDGDVCKILYRGLKNLEYRGYDSAGMAVLGNAIQCIKDAGSVDKVLSGADFKGARAGIAHTRWATHGKPNQVNSHPHFDCREKVSVIHNGIIENYSELKKALEEDGHIFKSQTDTEVIPHLIEKNISLGDFAAFKKAVSEIKGSYAIAALIDGSEKVYFARKFSPLVLGINGGSFLASDVVAFLPWTNKAIFVEDGEIGYIEKGRYYIEHEGRPVSRKPTEISWSFDQAEKEGHDHFMIKEILEQPLAITQTLADERLVSFSKHLSELERLVITSAGTSYHAGLAFKYATRLPLEVVISSEFTEVYRGGEVLSISQSGETADTLKAVRFAKSLDEEVDSLVNVVGSSLTRIADRTVYTHAGPEIGVAATKTFTAQMAALYAIDSLMKGNPVPKFDVTQAVNLTKKIRNLSVNFEGASHMFYIGRGPSSVTAMEGALKMKELAYIHAEAYPGGELKHGPLALIE
jgi:glucosamine--fructose-6-phosphate aminotransferase (isomerizing)